jgi:predicted protein tyrosine phosphatase
VSRILICPTDHAASVAVEHGPSHVVGIASPTLRAASGGRASAGLAAAQELHLAFNDIDAARPGLLAPGRADIAALLAFGRSWSEDRPFLVHCQMGVSRSTAAALILAAAARPKGDETALAAALRKAVPCATPNRLMLALADDLLGRGGRLVAAADGIGRGADYATYRLAVFELPAA